MSLQILVKGLYFLNFPSCAIHSIFIFMNLIVGSLTIYDSAILRCPKKPNSTIRVNCFNY